MRKKLLLTSWALALSCLSTMAQTLPTFSTDGNEIWYYLQFNRGSAVVQDMGDGSVLMTAGAKKGYSAQLWKVTGSQSNCEIISKNGRHIYYNSSSWSNSARFAASASESGS